MKYGICAWSVPGEFEDKMKLIAEIGFDGVSLGYDGSKDNDFLAKKENRDLVKEVLAKYNLSFPTLGVNGLCKYGMSKVEDEADVLQILEEAVQVAAEMNVKYLQLPSFGKGNISSKEELAQTIKCLRYVCEKALFFGISVGHESILDGEAMKTVLAEVEYENIFTYYDGGNAIGVEKLDPLSVLKDIYPSVWQLHIKDRHDDNKKPLLLGEGKGKVKEICGILKEKGYDGWIILESSYSNFEEYKNILEKDFAIIKELMA